MGSPTSLYRLFDDDGGLLYIGIAGNPGRRFDAHSGDKPWWGQVATIAVEHHPTRDAAREAEVDAIKTEVPRYNIAELPYEHDDSAPPTFWLSSGGRPITHGASATYRRHGCSCGACMKANREWQNAENQRRADALTADPSLAPHGRVATYTNWKCRCDDCRAAAAQHGRAVREAKTAKALQS